MYIAFNIISIMLHFNSHTHTGVRSLQFNHNLVSIGTGAGHIYFYDMRSRRYLNSGTRSQTGKPAACSLKASGGWLVHNYSHDIYYMYIHV